MASVPCPDPEVLAAWIDQGLGAADRAQLEAHLATCEDCRALVALVLETQDAIGESSRSGPLRSNVYEEPGRTSDHRIPVPLVRRWTIGAGLAAAAALLIILQAHAWWTRRNSGAGRLGATRTSHDDRGADSKLAGLVDAVARERTVEARLTGGFRHSPLRAPVRSGGSSAERGPQRGHRAGVQTADNWALYAAAGKIRKDSTRDPDAINLHALGLAHLLLGDHLAAVDALEAAVARKPHSASFHSDLAAAYLSRAHRLQQPDDLARALRAAERAIADDESLLEPYFNRALALERLFLDDAAVRAWDQYLDRDPSSAWAEEARTHVRLLSQGNFETGPSQRAETDHVARA